MPKSLEDPIALYQQQLAARETSAEEFARATHALFSSGSGRRWLGMAMNHTNFMGSVFSDADGMNPQGAAARDGQRAFISMILNMAFAGRNTSTTDPDDDE